MQESRDRLTAGVLALDDLLESVVDGALAVLVAVVDSGQSAAPELVRNVAHERGLGGDGKERQSGE